MELTHASFFSGVGGLDLGLERAGWRTVSFSEIDPYASAVLAQRWPGVPNLGDITALADRYVRAAPYLRDDRTGADPEGVTGGCTAYRDASLWSGGFPCQDLSVAGKRRGMVEGTRSNLAYAFLDLVERHRPPAVLLENVPGLLSSNAGRDFGALLDAMGKLGYGWAYRVLDARHFGVPQRRRRVFILGIHARFDPSGQRAAEVLSVGTRCERHPATGHETGAGVTAGADTGVDIAGSLTRRYGKGINSTLDDGAVVIDDGRSSSTHTAGTLRVGAADISKGGPGDTVPIVTVRPSPDADRDGAPDGLAGRPHHRDGVAATLNSGGNNGGFRTEPGEHLVTATLRVGASGPGSGGSGHALPLTIDSQAGGDDPMLPLGLDSHRYRCAGNGVVSSVSEYIGQRLAAYLSDNGL